jgi:hypothetical protein
MLYELQNLTKHLRRSLNLAVFPLHPRVRQVVAAERCRWTGSELDLQEADAVAARWLEGGWMGWFSKDDFKSETGAALAWGRAGVIEERCANLCWLVESGAFDCRIHAESPKEALLLLWKSRPSGPGIHVLGWEDEFVRAQVQEMITWHEA